MKKSYIEKGVAAAAAVAVTFTVISAVVAVAEHEREQAIYLAAQINPQHVAAHEVGASAR